MDEKTAAVRRMQDFISGHLTEPITLTDLSECSHFSPWYAARLFREKTGLAPADYVRRLRLSRSALMLRDEKCRVIDAAMAAGFDSVDGYQRAFLRLFGCNPGRYAASPVPLPLFIPYGVTAETQREECKRMFKAGKIQVEVIEKPAHRVLIKRGVKAEEYWDYCQEVGCDVWGVLTSMKSLCGEPVCLWLPEKYRTPGTSRYVQGVEVSTDYDGPIPNGFDAITLPTATYLLFRGEPFADDDYEEAILQVRGYIKDYDPSALGYRWNEDEPRIQLEPLGERGYIELKAVEKK